MRIDSQIGCPREIERHEKRRQRHRPVGREARHCRHRQGNEGRPRQRHGHKLHDRPCIVARDEPSPIGRHDARAQPRCHTARKKQRHASLRPSVRRRRQRRTERHAASRQSQAAKPHHSPATWKAQEHQQSERADQKRGEPQSMQHKGGFSLTERRLENAAPAHGEHPAIEQRECRRHCSAAAHHRHQLTERATSRALLALRYIGHPVSLPARPCGQGGAGRGGSPPAPSASGFKMAMCINPF